jgi:flagellar hook-associated protein 3 FlgL
MDRIATSTAYSNVLANLVAAQQAQSTAANQISSQKNASDLQGYSSSAETLVAMQTVQTQTTSYLDQSQVTAAKLSTQDLGMTQLNDSASGAVSAITEALGSGSGQSLMQALESSFQDAVGGLNTTYNGQYVFSGGQVTTPATSATTLSALATTTSVSTLFNNDQHIATAQLSQNSTVQTGQLASNLGTNLYTAFQAVAAYNADPTTGPFGNPLTQAQTTWLQGTIASFQTANTQLTTAQAQNGLVQKEVTAAQTDLTNQQTTMTNLLGNITDVDVAQATINLQQAQVAVQASAQAFNTLQNSSLLNYLQSSGG